MFMMVEVRVTQSLRARVIYCAMHEIFWRSVVF